MTDVLWVTTAYPWSGDPVGGTFHRTQTRGLIEAGVGVTVATPTPAAPWPMPLLRPSWRAYADAPVDTIDAGVRVLRPRYLNVPGQPSWAAPDTRMAAGVWRARSSWPRAQIVHGHYSIAGLAAWRVARRARLPLALTFHGSDLNLWPEEYPDRLGDLRTAVRSAALVLTVSRALAIRLRELTGVDARCLPLGIDHETVRSRTVDRTEARRRLGLDPAAPIALFVGNLLDAKGIRELVDAAPLLAPGTRVEIVGAGPEHGYRGSDPAVAARIGWHGLRPPEEIPVWLSAADVVVLPSRREGLPTILVEAGSVGTPVVASRVGGIPELLGVDRGTLLDQTTPEAIAAAIRSVVDDPSAAAAATIRLRDHVEAEHDARTNARRLADAYADLLRRQAVGA